MIASFDTLILLSVVGNDYGLDYGKNAIIYSGNCAFLQKVNSTLKSGRIYPIHVVKGITS